MAVISSGKEMLIDCNCKYGDSKLSNYLQSDPAVAKVHNGEVYVVTK